MTSQVERTFDLALVLRTHRDAIAAAWAERAPVMPGSHPAEPPPEENVGVIKRVLDAMADSLSAGSYAPLETLLNDITFVRVAARYDLEVVIESLLLIKQAIVPFIAGSPTLASPAAYQAIAQLDDCLLYMVGHLGRLFADMQRRLEEQQRRTALVLHAVQTASSSLELDVALGRVAEAMAEATRVPYCGIYLLHAERGVLAIKAAADGGDFHYTSRRHPLADLLSSPMLRELLEGKRSMILGEPPTDPRIAQEDFETLGLTLMLVLPIKVGEQVLGCAVLGAAEDDPTFTTEEIDLASGMVNAVALAIENVRLYEETCRRLDESQSLQRVTAALLQKLALADVLEIVCGATQRLTGALGSAVLLLEENDWLRVAYSSGGAPLLVDRTPVDGSFGGRALRHGQVMRAYDPAGHISSLPTSMPITALLAAPLQVRGAASGVLEAMNKPGGFTEEDGRIISLFADQAAIAIENARLRQQEEQLAVLEERQRLSRELHDSVTQALYSVTLFADAAARLLTAGHSAGALDHLQQVRGIAQEALREMRLLIFELRPLDLQQQGLVAALRARLAAVEKRAGLPVELHVEGERRLPRHIEDVLYRVAHEALNNVLKHAHARRATVRVRLGEARACLEVSDDGVGFDLAAAQAAGGLGLGGMSERVQRVGGTLEVESAPGQGTRVRVEAPLP
ncbi:MAG: GAF domain-containing sensor histidine kinase [Anaerolineae bacterium]|nr:GAF domain-containing sensor histidine kinase [Anaerolineae bacterium]